MADYVPFEGLPLKASGELAGYRWRFRGSIQPDGAHTAVELTYPDGNGGASGGVGALPLQDVGWKVMGHFGTLNWGDVHSETGGWPSWNGPGTVDGVVSADVERVVVQLDDDAEAEALVLESNDPAYKFFFLIYAPGTWWTKLLALHRDGSQLEGFARPDESDEFTRTDPSGTV